MEKPGSKSSMSCRICNLTFVSSQESIEHDFSLMHHIKSDQRKKSSVVHYCSLCGVHVGSLKNYVSHLDGKKHKDKTKSLKKGCSKLSENEPIHDEESRQVDDHTESSTISHLPALKAKSFQSSTSTGIPRKSKHNLKSQIDKRKSAEEDRELLENANNNLTTSVSTPSCDSHKSDSNSSHQLEQTENISSFSYDNSSFFKTAPSTFPSRPQFPSSPFQSQTSTHYYQTHWNDSHRGNNHWNSWDSYQTSYQQFSRKNYNSLPQRYWGRQGNYWEYKPYHRDGVENGYNANYSRNYRQTNYTNHSDFANDNVQCLDNPYWHYNNNNNNYPGKQSYRPSKCDDAFESSKSNNHCSPSSVANFDAKNVTISLGNSKGNINQKSSPKKIKDNSTTVLCKNGNSFSTTNLKTYSRKLMPKHHSSKSSPSDTVLSKARPGDKDLNEGFKKKLGQCDKFNSKSMKSSSLNDNTDKKILENKSAPQNSKKNVQNDPLHSGSKVEILKVKHPVVVLERIDINQSGKGSLNARVLHPSSLKYHSTNQANRLNKSQGKKRKHLIFLSSDSGDDTDDIRESLISVNKVGKKLAKQSCSTLEEKNCIENLNDLSLTHASASSSDEQDSRTDIKFKKLTEILEKSKNQSSACNKLLYGFVNYPRSRKEQLKLGKWIQEHTKNSKRMTLPRFNMQLGPSEMTKDLGITKDEDALFKSVASVVDNLPEDVLSSLFDCLENNTHQNELLEKTSENNESCTSSEGISQSIKETKTSNAKSCNSELKKLSKTKRCSLSEEERISSCESSVTHSLKSLNQDQTACIDGSLTMIGCITDDHYQQRNHEPDSCQTDYININIKQEPTDEITGSSDATDVHKEILSDAQVCSVEDVLSSPQICHVSDDPRIDDYPLVSRGDSVAGDYNDSHLHTSILIREHNTLASSGFSNIDDSTSIQIKSEPSDFNQEGMDNCFQNSLSCNLINTTKCPPSDVHSECNAVTKDHVTIQNLHDDIPNEVIGPESKGVSAGNADSTVAQQVLHSSPTVSFISTLDHNDAMLSTSGQLLPSNCSSFPVQSSTQNGGDNSSGDISRISSGNQLQDCGTSSFPAPHDLVQELLALSKEEDNLRIYSQRVDDVITQLTNMLVDWKGKKNQIQQQEEQLRIKRFNMLQILEGSFKGVEKNTGTSSSPVTKSGKQEITSHKLSNQCSSSIEEKETLSSLSTSVQNSKGSDASVAVPLVCPSSCKERPHQEISFTSYPSHEKLQNSASTTANMCSVDVHEIKNEQSLNSSVGSYQKESDHVASTSLHNASTSKESDSPVNIKYLGTLGDITLEAVHKLAKSFPPFECSSTLDMTLPDNLCTNSSSSSHLNHTFHNVNNQQFITKSSTNSLKLGDLPVVEKSSVEVSVNKSGKKLKRLNLCELSSEQDSVKKHSKIMSSIDSCSPMKRMKYSAAERIQAEPNNSKNSDLNNTHKPNEMTHVVEKQCDTGNISASEELLLRKRGSCVNSNEVAIEELVAHKSAITDIKVCGGYLYTCSSDTTAKRFHLEDPKNFIVYGDHQKTVSALFVTTLSAGTCLFTTCHDGFLRRFDAKTGECLKKVNLKIPVLCMEEGWGKLFLGLHTGSVAIYSLLADKQIEYLKSCTSSISCIATTSQGAQRLLCVVSYDGVVTIWDASTRFLIRCLEGRVKPPSIIRISGNSVYITTTERSLVIHDLSSGKLERKASKWPSSATGLHVFDNYVLVCSFDGAVRCYNRKDLTLHSTFYGAGKAMVMCMDVYHSWVFTANRKGVVGAFKFDVGNTHSCKINGCNFKFGRPEDLSHHLTKDHCISSFNKKLMSCP